MIAHCWRKSDGTLTAWCGTKNDRIMNSPTTAVMRSGNSRFKGLASLARHPAREAMDAQGLEQAAHEQRRDHGELHEIGALQRADQLGLFREIGAGRVQLLPDQSVVARHHEERQLVHVRRPGYL